MAEQVLRDPYNFDFLKRVRRVAIPLWVKHAINAWTAAAKIEDGPLLRSIRKGGKYVGESLSAWAIWSVVERSARQIGFPKLAPHDLRRTSARSSAAKRAATSSRSSSFSDIRRYRQRNVILVRSRTLPSR